MVFTSHFNQYASDIWFGRFGEFGWAGVDLFFVLSGFLMTTQLLKEIKKTGTISIRQFYLRRGFRIWPNFLIVLAAYYFFPGIAERSILAPIWKYLSFTLNLSLDYGITGAFSHAWSLCVEEQFYLLLPLILLLLFPFSSTKRSMFMVSLILAAEVAFRHYRWTHFTKDFFYFYKPSLFYRQYYENIYYPTLCRLDPLVIGAAIAAFYNNKPNFFSSERSAKIGGNTSFVLAIFFLICSFYLTRHEAALWASCYGYLLNGVGFGFLLLSALSTRGIFSQFKGKWARHVANLAFSFYLVHKSVIHHCHLWLIHMGIDPGSILYPVMILACAATASALLYFGIEKPTLKLRDRLLRKKSFHFG